MNWRRDRGENSEEVMPQESQRKRLETEAVIVGYAMSRLDDKYLGDRDCRSWQEAFKEAADALTVPGSSIKNLRDEFDPVHGNRRRGWHRRPLRSDRHRVLDELKDVSNEALLELVNRILDGDHETVAEAVDSISAVTGVAHNVAERLLTGRRAEDYFIEHSADIVGVEPTELLDYRQAARGFDFGVHGDPSRAIEVKGIKQLRGDILLTDREWSEAGLRRSDYWLVVVGNLNSDPVPQVFRDPYGQLDARCVFSKSVTANWRSTVSVVSSRP